MALNRKRRNRFTDIHAHRTKVKDRLKTSRSDGMFEAL